MINDCLVTPPVTPVFLQMLTSVTSTGTPHRRWCFTLNNPTLSQAGDIEAFSRDHCQYLIYGIETASTGTRHFQGYLELKKPQRLSYFRRNFPQAHMSVARGDHLANVTYCSKDDETPFIYDKRVGSGHRSDLTAACAIVKAGGLKALAREMPEQVVRHHKGFVALTALLLDPPTRFRPKYVTWFWGPTGVGKTRKVYDAMDAFIDDLHRQPHTFQWFDGYRGQRAALFDDFRGTGPEKWPHFTFSMLLVLLDGYPMDVPVKGGFVPWFPTHIFITAPTPPADMFVRDADVGAINQLLRRIDVIEEVLLADPPAPVAAAAADVHQFPPLRSMEQILAEARGLAAGHVPPLEVVLSSDTEEDL